MVKVRLGEQTDSILNAQLVSGKNQTIVLISLLSAAYTSNLVNNCVLLNFLYHLQYNQAVVFLNVRVSSSVIYLIVLLACTKSIYMHWIHLILSVILEGRNSYSSCSGGNQGWGSLPSIMWRVVDHMAWSNLFPSCSVWELKSFFLIPSETTRE